MHRKERVRRKSVWRKREPLCFEAYVALEHSKGYEPTYEKGRASLSGVFTPARAPCFFSYLGYLCTFETHEASKRRQIEKAGVETLGSSNTQLEPKVRGASLRY